jgi:hypothetical protein
MADAGKTSVKKGREPTPPSRNRKADWLHAFAPGVEEAEPSDADTEAGKWMMFVAEQYVDDTWKNVSLAVREGRLAYYAKVSTKASQAGAFPYVLCVYVQDWRDKGEAMALRERLREMGFKRKIHFKRDSMTLAGLSGSEYSA